MSSKKPPYSCMDCKGTGWIDQSYLLKPDRKCKTCKGTGKVERN